MLQLPIMQLPIMKLPIMQPMYVLIILQVNVVPELRKLSKNGRSLIIQYHPIGADDSPLL